jgi:hypothetical protein
MKGQVTRQMDQYKKVWFRAQHASWPYTYQGVKILTIHGQLQLEKNNEGSSSENGETVAWNGAGEGSTAGGDKSTMCLQLAFSSVLAGARAETKPPGSKTKRTACGSYCTSWKSCAKSKALPGLV